ncbi:MAG: hypothetical protein QF744_15810 [SAR202 cluster bacterium]|nr:hypothetical protein [SAR202 cluster bacterium]
MSYVMRRVFHGKAGCGADLIRLCTDANFMVRGLGMAIKPRVVSDYVSGRTDTVVVEWETESVAELLSVNDEVEGDKEAWVEFGEWMEQIADLIEYAEAEMWQTH